MLTGGKEDAIFQEMFYVTNLFFINLIISVLRQKEYRKSSGPYVNDKVKPFFILETVFSCSRDISVG